ncbi:hypothetical protein SDC9_188238 [bioreactor metagenome]|uniref:Uncharacterized protein n=1 Tax=bioreactor metagenome TaxID=1076179 RepID=A0A645HR34_9ZZZZ
MTRLAIIPVTFPVVFIYKYLFFYRFVRVSHFVHIFSEKKRTVYLVKGMPSFKYTGLEYEREDNINVKIAECADFVNLFPSQDIQSLLAFNEIFYFKNL